MYNWSTANIKKPCSLLGNTTQEVIGLLILEQVFSEAINLSAYKSSHVAEPLHVACVLLSGCW